MTQITLTETKTSKHLRSETYNFDFDKKSGFFARWGRTKEDDPQAGLPEIADIEITTKCSGPGGKLCKFCSPAGTMVHTIDGNIPIELISVGSIVKSFDGENIVNNEVVEIYKHSNATELIKIELADGSVIELTPDHEVFLMDGTLKSAGELCEGDDVRTYN